MMKRLFWMLAALGFAALACGPIDLARDLLGRLATPTTASELHETVWYVALDGDDSNSCTEVTQSCRTVQAAIEKSDDDDFIEIGPGTFQERAPGIAAGIFIEGKTISLRGTGTDSTFLEPSFSHMSVVVLRDANVGISGLTIRGGAFGLQGNNAELRLSRVNIEDNENFGLLISDARSRFDFSNLTVQRNVGGLSLEGEGELRSSRIVENEGVGLINGAALTVIETSIEANRAAQNAGIQNNAGSTLTVDRSTISHNSASSSSDVSFGVRNEGTMTIVNSTVSNNRSSVGASGNAIGNLGDLTLVHATVAANLGVGLVGYGGSISFENTLIGDNLSQDCAITASSNTFVGVSLDSDDSCVRWFSSERTTHSLSIAPLADNGGLTETHALLPDSPAIDAASGDCPAVDQRGTFRPAGTGCDVGAFEFDPLASATPISQEGTPIPPPLIVTPTVQSLPTLSKDALCWKGPGPLYEVISSVQQGTQVTLLGRGIEGDWWIIDNPRYPGVVCWLPGDMLEIDPSLIPDDLVLYKAPPLPTPTPTPILGCLYQGANDPQPLCYPIDSCPVPFNQSQGSCTP